MLIPRSHWLLISVTLLMTVLAMPSKSWANSCIGPVSLPVFCTISEDTPEVVVGAVLTGLTFGASAQGVVVIYDDAAHTLVSDVAVFTNVLGVATVGFISDTEGVVPVPSGLPILGKFTEGNPFSISVALANGNFLTASICSDVTESSGCSGGSDSIGLAQTTSPVPEPGTLLLVGSGLLSSALVFRKRSGGKTRSLFKYRAV